MAILLRKNQTRTWNGCSITDTSRRRVGSLADRNPELAKEWHPIKNGDLTPAQVTPGSGKKVWWICIREHDGRLRYIIGQVELVVLTSTGNTHALRNLNMVIFFLLCIK